MLNLFSKPLLFFSFRYAWDFECVFICFFFSWMVVIFIYSGVPGLFFSSFHVVACFFFLSLSFFSVNSLSWYCRRAVESFVCMCVRALLQTYYENKNDVRKCLRECGRIKTRRVFLMCSRVQKQQQQQNLFLLYQ